MKMKQFDRRRLIHFAELSIHYQDLCKHIWNTHEEHHGNARKCIKCGRMEMYKLHPDYPAQCEKYRWQKI